MAASKSRSPARQSSRDMNSYSDEFRDGISKVSRGVSEMATSAASATRAQINPMTEYVQENPIQSVLIAAGIGAVVGMFFLRR